MPCVAFARWSPLSRPTSSCAAVLAYLPRPARVLVVAPCFTGDGTSQALSELRELPGLVSDDVRRRSFISQQHVFNPAYGEERAYWKGHFVRELPG